MASPGVEHWGLLGHQRPIETLGRMLWRGRLPHALLFTGALGVGKFSLALALTKAVNCLERSPTPPGEEAAGLAWAAPCGACPSCDKLERGLHPDLHVLSPSGKAHRIKVAEVREVRAKLGYKPFEGRMTTLIIKQADRLGAESGNSLLKILEEPPPATLLILTATSEADLLPTLVSRCARLKLGGLPLDLIAGRLESRQGLEPERAALVAALSGGALGQAQKLQAEWAWEIWQKLVQLFSSHGVARMQAALSLSATLAKEEESWPEALSLLRAWWREALLWGRPHQGPVNWSGNAKAAMSALAAAVSINDLSLIMAALDNLEESLARFLRPPELAFENYFLTVLELLGAKK